MATIHEEIVDAMNAISGVHPGFRAAHAKGSMCTGTFAPSAEAKGLTRASHLQGNPVEVAARLSNGGGKPDSHDAQRLEGRGLAVKFHLPDGEATDIVSLTLPVFFVRDENDFLDFLRARKPDPETGEMDMEKIGAFIGRHPETQAALEKIVPTLVPPQSYATCAYNSLHAFAFTNREGERRFGRYRWEPEAGQANLTEEEIESASRDYLQDDLRRRLAEGSIGFTLAVRLAEEGDPLDDPTVAWPEERESVTLGKLELTAPAEETELTVFDPNNLTDGIEATDDRILAARSPAYSVSAERRAAARAQA